MTSQERFERQVEFVLKQQAQFYAEMREMDERFSRQTARNAEQIQQLTRLVFRTVRVVEELGRRMDGP